MTLDNPTPGRPDLVRHHLQEAVRSQPDNAKAHGEVAHALLEQGQVEQAEFHARRAVELSPSDVRASAGLASLLETIGKTDESGEIVKRLVRGGHETSQLAVLYATIASRLKCETEALGLIMRLLHAGKSRQPREQAHLHFAAAQLLDGLGRYDEAFEQASRANAARAIKYDPGPADRLIRDFTEYFTRPTLRSLPHATHGNETPVFIVGLPRSGSTLVEQILASHPLVHGAGELDWIFPIWESVVRRCGAGVTPLSSCFDRLSARDADEFADQYLLPLAALDGNAARIVNKMPSNFMHLGLIQILFPLARVIHCRRHPLDTCLSCYMTDFATGNNFSYSLPSAGHLYVQCARMMSHWKSVLHLPILEIDYEKVVSDLEGQSRAMIEFLGLEWDDKCLHFYKNKRFVATASSAQVRRPIYHTSVDRWRNYDRHLSPLRAALGPVLGSS